MLGQLTRVCLLVYDTYNKYIDLFLGEIKKGAKSFFGKK